MHRRSLLMSGAALALTAACAAPTTPGSDPSNPATPPNIDPSDANFDTGLYRAIATEPGNQFISPYSVSACFALVYPGAGGATATEIANTFGYDTNAQTEAQRTRTRADGIRNETGGSELNIANAAWVEETMQLRPAYARTISETMGGRIESVPFIANQPAALRTINAWAARETRDRIPTILTEENPDRRLVLTNAIYFKGKWTHQFQASSTRDGDFFTGANTRVPARLMRQLTNARYFETPTFQAADFDYDDGAFALAVFLPRQRTGLAAFERELTGENLDAWMSNLAGAQRPRLDVTLPKVEMRANYLLNEPLKAMGVRQAFTPSADLDAMANDTTLMISQVIHKTFLAIDEEGTEAAAVTAVDIVTTAAPGGPPPPPPIEFKADHPFFIVLHHKPTRTRLFMGRIATV
jgi:serpin B